MRTVLAALGLVAVGLFCSGSASAQCDDLPPLGTPYTCYFVGGDKVVVLPGGPVPSSSDGSATVYVVGYNYNPCEVLLSPEQFSSTGSGKLGRLGTNLAPGSPKSKLTGQNSKALFPADLELNLNITATADALNGTFTSQGPLTLRASGIQKLPLTNVELKQDGAVKLVNEKREVIGLEGVHVVLNRGK